MKLTGIKLVDIILENIFDTQPKSKPIQKQEQNLTKEEIELLYYKSFHISYAGKDSCHMKYITTYETIGNTHKIYYDKETGYYWNES